MLKEFLNQSGYSERKMKEIYQLIHSKGPITKIDLTKMMNIKPPTMNRLIQELLDRGFIYECGHGDSSGGRPPQLFKITEDLGYLIGVNINRVDCRVVLLNLNFQQMDNISFSITSVHKPEIVIARLKQIIHDLLITHNISESQFLGIGIASPGTLDQENGVILNFQSFPAPGWENIAIVDELKSEFHVNIFLESGSNMSPIAETFYHRLQKSKVLYCISAVDLGCGFIVNGELLNNSKSNVIAFGHTVIDLNGPECICGNKGCLTAFTSIERLFKNIQESTVTLEPFSYIQARNSYSASLEEVRYHLQASNEKVKEMLLTNAEYLGVGLANFANTLQPDYIFINSPLIDIYEKYYEHVIEVAKSRIYSPLLPHIHFLRGKLGGDAAAVGAGIYVFQRYFQN